MGNVKEFLWPKDDLFGQGVALGIFVTTVIWLVAVATT